MDLPENWRKAKARHLRKARHVTQTINMTVMV